MNLCLFAITTGLVGATSLRGADRKLSDDTTDHVNFLIFQPDDLNFVWPERPDAADTVRHLTPHIDLLRSEGAVFTRGYSAGSMCAPSRVGLLTGRYPSKSKSARAAVDSEGCTKSNDEFTNLAGSVVSVTVPNCKLARADKLDNVQTALQGEGYSTFMVGKWHLAASDAGLGKKEAAWLPTDTAYPAAVQATKATGWTDAGGLYIDNLNDYDLGFSHNLEWMTAAAVGFIEQAHSEGKPFFLYMNPTAPHTPSISDAMDMDITSTPEGEVEDPLEQSGMPTRAEIRAQADGQLTGDRDQSPLGPTWVDESLGAVYDKLKALGILDNTMVVFVLDHGNAGKGTLTEAGVRIAYNIRYPAHPIFAAGSYYDDLVSNVDLAPTILEVATGTTDHGYNADGSSLLNIDPATASTDLSTDNSLSFVDESPMVSWSVDRALFVENDKDRAVITQRYKYVAYNLESCSSDSTSDQEGVRLYDLQLDPTESVDRAGQKAYAKVESKLKRLMRCHLVDTVVGGSGVTDACSAILAQTSGL